MYNAFTYLYLLNVQVLVHLHLQYIYNFHHVFPSTSLFPHPITEKALDYPPKNLTTWANKKYFIPPQVRVGLTTPSLRLTYSSLILSPTGIPSDPPLTSHGAEQSLQLANAVAKMNDPPIRQVYSRLFYRCLQTVEPFMKKVARMGG